MNNTVMFFIFLFFTTNQSIQFVKVNFIATCFLKIEGRSCKGERK